MSNITELTTETENKITQNIDSLSSLEIVSLINQEDATIANAVQKELPAIAAAVDEIAKRYQEGGRIIYIGAGSSGRMGTLDAVELTPTYSVDPSRAFGIMAGGKEAMYRAIEGAEDSKELAIEDLQKVELSELDSVIGIAASGRTPYTISALEYAKKIGACTIAITCNASSELAKAADISIAPVVGAEVISGSTRMKAGTAQKMVVNMLSTGVMVRIGKVYKNYMVQVQPTNIKLVARAKNMIQKIVDVDAQTAETLFEQADGNVATAVVMHLKQVSKDTAITALQKTNGNVRKALALL